MRVYTDIYCMSECVYRVYSTYMLFICLRAYTSYSPQLLLSSPYSYLYSYLIYGRISSGADPDTRFSRVEKFWPYFLGFGLPYLLLMKLTDFYVGYGLFLALFPFCIMLGSIYDYRVAQVYTGGNTQMRIPPLPVFGLARKWTQGLLRSAGRVYLVYVWYMYSIIQESIRV